jgi:signal transduction histidine kinase
LITHIRLYQQAYDHEKFAQAFANLATRLNEAVVEPEEMAQLICKEGAHALGADYTLLYIKGNEEQLLPLCASTNEQDAVPSIPPPNEWPSIHLHEYEGKALHSLQPMLLSITEQWVTTQKRRALSELPLRSTRRSRPSSLREMLAHYSVRSAILAPLIFREDRVGLLVFARVQDQASTRERKAFDAFDLPQAEDFGKQAGVALTNARLYQSLSEAHERLKELDQMKDNFMITASHELRTPLTAVQGYIELMAEYDEMLPSEQRREFLQKARRGCDELAVLLGNVMDASRLESDIVVKPALMKRVSVQEMIESVIILIEPHITKEQRTLEITIPPALAVYADPVRLRQVLMNISTNALKYSPPGSPITFIARAAGPCIIISISDKGKGVKPEEQARIFQRFYRQESDVNSPIRGSGLGLYISHRLIAAMGGKIWVESSGIAGEGSTFHIQLPTAS